MGYLINRHTMVHACETAKLKLLVRHSSCTALRYTLRRFIEYVFGRLLHLLEPSRSNSCFMQCPPRMRQQLRSQPHFPSIKHPRILLLGQGKRRGLNGPFDDQAAFSAACSAAIRHAYLQVLISPCVHMRSFQIRSKVVQVAPRCLHAT